MGSVSQTQTLTRKRLPKVIKSYADALREALDELEGHLRACNFSATVEPASRVRLFGRILCKLIKPKEYVPEPFWKAGCLSGIRVKLSAIEDALRDGRLYDLNRVGTGVESLEASASLLYSNIYWDQTDPSKLQSYQQRSSDFLPGGWYDRLGASPVAQERVDQTEAPRKEHMCMGIRNDGQACRASRIADSRFCHKHQAQEVPALAADLLRQAMEMSDG